MSLLYHHKTIPGKYSQPAETCTISSPDKTVPRGNSDIDSKNQEIISHHITGNSVEGIAAGIEINNLSMKYSSGKGDFQVLDNLNLQIRRGEFIAIIGPSGCGKSTLLDIIAGLVHPSGGEVVINGNPINGPGPDRGMVFQDYSLFPWMNIIDNLVFAIEHTNGLKGQSAREKAEQYIDAVGLSAFQNSYPMMLSGGMRQRLAIARMFSMGSSIFLMDEPFGALDSLNRIYMQELLLHLWIKSDSEKSIVLVTHDIDEAIFLADRVIVMSPNPGRIIEDIDIPFQRPRERENTLRTPEYVELRSHLLSVLYGEMIEQLSLQQKQIQALA